MLSSCVHEWEVCMCMNASLCKMCATKSYIFSKVFPFFPFFVQGIYLLFITLFLSNCFCLPHWSVSMFTVHDIPLSFRNELYINCNYYFRYIYALSFWFPATFRNNTHFILFLPVLIKIPLKWNEWRSWLDVLMAEWDIDAETVSLHW